MAEDDWAIQRHHRRLLLAPAALALEGYAQLIDHSISINWSTVLGLLSLGLGAEAALTAFRRWDDWPDELEGPPPPLGVQIREWLRDNLN